MRLISGCRQGERLRKFGKKAGNKGWPLLRLKSLKLAQLATIELLEPTNVFCFFLDFLLLGQIPL